MTSHPDVVVPTDPAHPPTTLAAGGRRAEWQPRLPVGWVLLDVDGTLVGPTGAVTQPVIDAVRQVADSGVHIGYATGRNVDGVTGVHAQLDLPGPHVVLNGAQVRLDGSALETWALTTAQLTDLLAWCAAQGDYAELYTDAGFLVTSMDQRFRSHWDMVIGQPMGTVADHPPAPGAVIKATIVTTSPDHTAKVIAAVEGMGLSAGAATSPMTPGMVFINITRADVDKGTAIVAAAADLGITTDQVVVIGDGRNDLPMLAVAGTAVAMGDADPVVQAAAHLVTGGVEADGAAMALHDVLRWMT